MSLSLQLSDTRELNLPDQQVWAFLSDMEQVAVCAPGFRSLTPPTRLPYAEQWTAHIRILGIGMNIIINRSLCDPVQQRMLVQAFGKKLGSEVMLDVELDLDPQDSQHTRVTWKAIISIQGPVAAAGQRAVERDIQRFFDTLLARLQAWASAAQVSVPPPSAKQPGRLISWQSWLWPWYLIAGFATLILAMLVASTTGPNQQITALSLLALTVLAAGIMLLERLPEILILVASLAVWTTCWGFAKPDPTRTLSILALLCVPLFATQYIWRDRLSTQRPFLEQALPRILGMGGLLLLFPISLVFTADQRSVP
ncbi:MAG TPA: SRPBCC domain-containing protein, partial [Ktedonobacteraceae bacterium]|nr:SRPBCC domain-containing protein [Ktedonobacteraceae bacterium]